MVKSIFINQRELSRNNSPYIIAEISANHNGSLERALDTIVAAKRAGADAVKIQTYTPDTMTIQSEKEDFLITKGLWKGRSLYDLYQEGYTPFEWHSRLFEHAKKIDITLFSSPFDETAVDLLETLGTPAYKVASFELIDLPLIEYIAKKGKPMLLSTGMGSLEEIGQALEVAQTSGCVDIGIFHCISSYPTSIDQANLSSIKILEKEFNVQVGLSDHTLGNTASVVATGLGATFLEKHLTLSRLDGGLDSQFSLEADEMIKFVMECRNAYDSLGKGTFIRSVTEEENTKFRRSLYFVEDLKKGQTIEKQHVRRIRPGFGLPPKYLKKVLGAKVKKDVFKGDKVDFDSFR